METLLGLDSKDIKKILAEHFKVPEGHVVVYTREIMTGYGTDEHTVHLPVASILLEKDGDNGRSEH